VGLEPLGETESLMNPEPDDADEGPIPEEAMGLAVDIGYGVAAVVLLVLIYAATASLLFTFGGPALLYADEVRWSHDVNIDSSGDGRTVVVTGKTPANELTFQYINDTNSTTVVAEDTIRIDNNRNIQYNNSTIPPNATGVRVKYQGILSWTVARSEGLPQTGSAGNNGPVDGAGNNDDVGSAGNIDTVSSVGRADITDRLADIDARPTRRV
jgi:hypothetical protein